MAGDLNIALILKLVDQITGPAKPALATLKNIGTQTENIGRRGVDWSNQQIEANQARRQAMQGEAMAVAGYGFAFYQAMKPAVEFESAMAGVSKVLDFDAPDGLKTLGDEILDLTTNGGLPMVAEDIAAIIEAAGQAGVVDKALPDEEERRQLIAFATDAAKMGVAFDLAADVAGKAMATWRSSLGLTQEEALGLGDAINHLSNNMNATAPALVDIVRRQGAVAKLAGLAAKETAALASAILAGGASTEVAATGMKNFLNSLTKGEALTVKQAAVLKSLGIEGTELARRMQVDAKGGIIAVLEALAQLPEHAQSAALGQLFGEESKGAIAPLLTNLDNLRDAFGLVADPIEYAGAMLAEYEVQAGTTANALILTSSFVRGLAVATGSILLPELNSLLATIQPIIQSAIDWAKAHPELISQMAQAAALLLSFKVATLGLRWAFLATLSPFLHLIKYASYLPLLLGKGMHAAGVFARVLSWLATGPIKMVIGAIRLIGIAAAANPFTALVLAISALAFAIYDNWGPIVTWLTDKIDAVRNAFDTGLINGVLKTLSEFNPFVLIMEAANGLFTYITGWSFGDIFGAITRSRPFATIIDGANRFFTYVTGWDFSVVIASITSAFAQIDLFQHGVNIIQSLWDGASTLVVQMVAALSAKLSAIVPGWMQQAWAWVAGGQTGGPAQPPAGVVTGGEGYLPPSMRDSGGPVRAGFPYIVGEREREVFWPGVSGSIMPGRALRAAVAASAMALPAAAGPIPADIFQTTNHNSALVQNAANSHIGGNIINDVAGAVLAKGEDGQPGRTLRTAAASSGALRGGAPMPADLFQTINQNPSLVQNALKNHIGGNIINDVAGAVLAKGEDGQPGRTLRTAAASSGALRGAAPIPADILHTINQNSALVQNTANHRTGGNIINDITSAVFTKIMGGHTSQTLSGAMSAPVMALPSMGMQNPADLIQRIDQRPALSAPAPAQNITRQGDTINITVTAAPGMNEQELAYQVRREIERMKQERSGDLHDGEYF